MKAGAACFHVLLCLPLPASGQQAGRACLCLLPGGRRQQGRKAAKQPAQGGGGGGGGEPGAARSRARSACLCLPCKGRQNAPESVCSCLRAPLPVALPDHTLVLGSARLGERQRKPSSKAAADAPERTVGAKHKAGGDVTDVVGRKAKKVKKGPKTLKAKKGPKTLRKSPQCEHGHHKDRCKVVSRVRDVPDACVTPTM